jgi:Na+/citrate or Na+/malate symporter
MSKYFTPIAGLALFLFALFTVPPVWAQAATSGDAAASLAAVPVLGNILEQVQKWLPVVFQIVGAFSMIAAMTANETDDKVVNAILKVINLLGMNFGTAANDPNVGVNRSSAPQP